MGFGRSIGRAARIRGASGPDVMREGLRRAAGVASAVLLLAVVFVMGELGGPPAPDGSAPGIDRNPVVFAPGRMVAIGGGRTLYLRCTGSGNPTVLLASGSAEASYDWLEVQGPLSRITRTCAYDRAGTGNSLPAPGPSTPAADVADLRRLAAAAKLPGPYVLVGASYGGLLAALYARAYPDDTAGLVLVDAITQGLAQRSFGPLPLVVITRGRNDDAGPALTQAAQAHAQLRSVMMEDRLASLFIDRVHVIALLSGSGIWRPVAEQPGVVIEGVRAVVQAVRTRSRLPTCANLYHTAGTRCPYKRAGR